MRIALATLLAPIAVPLWFRLVLGFYVHRPVSQAAPLLPWILAGILFTSYLVTVFVGLPVWTFLTRQGKTSAPLAATVGTALGLLIGAVFLCLLTRSSVSLIAPFGCGRPKKAIAESTAFRNVRAAENNHNSGPPR